MEKIFHNKKANTGLLFELLAQQVVSNTVSKNDIKAKKSLYLMRKYFKPGTQLFEELQLVNAIIYNEVSSWRTASRLLSEVLSGAAKLDTKKLHDEKYRLISEINANFDRRTFYNSFVPSYRIYGSIYSLIEAQRVKKIPIPGGFITPSFDVAQKVKLEEVVLNHLMDNAEIKRMNEFKNAVPKFKEVDDLAFAFVLKKFNQKYRKVLTESQKEILREYIRCTSERKFDQFVEKKRKSIENSLYESIKVADKPLVAKIYEAMMKLTRIDTAKKDKKAEILMTYAQLCEELQKLEKENGS
jgi:hypothetical protein